jgi:hypothetical protein
VTVTERRVIVAASERGRPMDRSRSRLSRRQYVQRVPGPAAFPARAPMEVWMRMLHVRVLLTALLGPLLIAASFTSQSDAAQTSDLVFAQSGTMPIILTASHGGNTQVPGVPQRTRV